MEGDTVELSNLNRQNYTNDDIGEFKAVAIYNRLKAINPGADIKFYPEFITFENIENIIGKHQIAINTLEFTGDMPLVFDQLFQKKKVTVLHPPTSHQWETSCVHFCFSVLPLRKNKRTDVQSFAI